MRDDARCRLARPLPAIALAWLVAACGPSLDPNRLPSGDAGGGGAATGTTTTGTTSTSTTSVVPSCDAYPTAGEGINVGYTVPSMLEWEGYVDASTTPTLVTSADYWDCDGSRGINAVLIQESGTWCDACRVEAQGLNAELANGWAAAGIKVLTLMIQDESYDPATLDTALAWKQQYQLDTSTVAADPQFSFALPGTMGIALPLSVIVDPRTMRIVDKKEGLVSDYSVLTDLAAVNKP